MTVTLQSSLHSSLRQCGMALLGVVFAFNLVTVVQAASAESTAIPAAKNKNHEPKKEQTTTILPLNDTKRETVDDKSLQARIRELDKSEQHDEHHSLSQHDDKIPLIELDDRQDDWDDDDGSIFDNETDEHEREHQHEQEHEERD